MSGTSDSTPEASERRFVDEIYEDIGEAIPRMVRKRETVVGTLNRFRRDRLAGEEIQSTLNTALRQLDEDLPFLLSMLDTHGIENTVNILVEDGYLDPDLRSEATDLCRQLEWAAPTGEAIIQQSRGFNYWTNIEMGYAKTTDSGVPLFGQRARQGVDELWDVQAPFPVFGEQILREIIRFENTLDQLPADANLSEADVTKLRSLVNALQESVDDLDQTVSDRERLHETESIEDYDDILG